MLGGISADKRTRALRNLSAEIGLDLSQNDTSYALVQRKRKNGVVVHGSFENGRCLHGQPENFASRNTGGFESKAVLDILGSATVDLCSHIIFIEGEKLTVPNLRMSKTAYSDIKNRMCCSQFYGGLRLTNSDGSKSLVVMNGIVFEADTEGIVSVTSDLRASPSKEILNKHFTNVQFSLIAAEARINFLLSRESSAQRDAALQLIRDHLLWLGGVAGECTELKSTSYDPVIYKGQGIISSSPGSQSCSLQHWAICAIPQVQLL